MFGGFGGILGDEKEKASIFSVVKAAAKQGNIGMVETLEKPSERANTRGIKYRKRPRRNSTSHENWSALKQVFKDKSKRLRKCVSRCKLLEYIIKNSNQDFLSKFIWSMQERTYRAGEYLMREGDEGNEMFVLQSGRVSVLVEHKKDPDDSSSSDEDEDNNVEQIASLGNWSVVGEIALLTNAKRSASVMAVTDLNVSYINRETFRRICKKNRKELCSETEKRYDGSINVNVFDSIPIFDSLNSEEKRCLMDVMKPRVYSDDDVICFEGEEAEEMFILVQGSVIISKLIRGRSRQINRFDNKAYFGEFSLLDETEKRSATAKACCLPGNPVVLYVLSRFAFHSIVPHRIIQNMKTSKEVILRKSKAALAKYGALPARRRVSVGGNYMPDVIPLLAMDYDFFFNRDRNHLLTPLALRKVPFLRYVQESGTTYKDYRQKLANKCRSVLEMPRAKRKEGDVQLTTLLIRATSFYTSFCPEFNPYQLRELALSASMCSLTRKEILYTDGDYSSDVYIVLSGKIAVKQKVDWITQNLVLKTSSDKQHATLRYHSGDFFGESCLHTLKIRLGTAKAENVSELLRVSAKDFNRIRDMGSAPSRVQEPLSKESSAPAIRKPFAAKRDAAKREKLRGRPKQDHWAYTRLRNCDVFRQTSINKLYQLAGRLRVITVPRHGLVVRRNEFYKCAYIIHEGCLGMKGPDSKSVIHEYTNGAFVCTPALAELYKSFGHESKMTAKWDYDIQVLSASATLLEISPAFYDPLLKLSSEIFPAILSLADREAEVYSMFQESIESKLNLERKMEIECKTPDVAKLCFSESQISRKPTSMVDGLKVDKHKLSRYGLKEQYGGSSPLDVRSATTYILANSNGPIVTASSQALQGSLRNIMKRAKTLPAPEKKTSSASWTNPLANQHSSYVCKTTDREISSFPVSLLVDSSETTTKPTDEVKQSSEKPSLLDDSGFLSAFFQSSESAVEDKNSENAIEQSGSETILIMMDQPEASDVAVPITIQMETLPNGGDSSEPSSPQMKSDSEEIFPAKTEGGDLQTAPRLVIDSPNSQSANEQNSMSEDGRNANETVRLASIGTPPQTAVSLRQIMSQEQSESRGRARRRRRGTPKVRPPSPGIEGWDPPAQDLSDLRAASLRAMSTDSSPPASSKSPKSETRPSRRKGSRASTPKKDGSIRAGTPKLRNRPRQHQKHRAGKFKLSVEEEKTALVPSITNEGDSDLSESVDRAAPALSDRPKAPSTEPPANTGLPGGSGTFDDPVTAGFEPPSPAAVASVTPFPEDLPSQRLSEVKCPNRDVQEIGRLLSLGARLCRAIPFVVQERKSIQNKGFVQKVKDMWTMLKSGISGLSPEDQTSVFQKMQVTTAEVISELGKVDQRLSADFLQPWVRGNELLYDEDEMKERAELLSNNRTISQLFQEIWGRVTAGVDGSGHLTENGYGAVFSRISGVLQKEFSFSETVPEIKKEYEIRARRCGGHVDIFAFRDSIFELVNIWCQETSQRAFQQFFSFILDVTPEGGIATAIALYDSAAGGNKQALYQYEKVSKKLTKKLAYLSPAASPVAQTDQKKLANTTGKRQFGKDRRRQRQRNNFGAMSLPSMQETDEEPYGNGIGPSSPLSNNSASNASFGRRAPASPQQQKTRLKLDSDFLNNLSESSSDSDSDSSDGEEGQFVGDSMKYSNVSGSCMWWREK